MSEHKPQEVPLQVEVDVLSEAALDGIIDNFIQREGTDYGVNEFPYESKVRQIRAQIEKGDVKIVFDPKTESVTLMTAREWKKLSQQHH